MVYAPGEKPGKEPEEVKLQNASKQIVEKVILQAVQQVSQEEEHGEKKSNRRAGQEVPSSKIKHKQ
ncbi:A-kinase anchor protein inhibitor 1 [Pelobates fuscus]|uniref:A-kinase anchor protein inhibitor 1 n=1 Tax=Pelobates fuscus TaxID=191477 RepID=UPI002FE4691C